ncbi:helix-turn-helix domain-containing protein [Sporolactobacillus shoreicorticis]|uniref:Helix-turn-helix domain-containing protein n=1 Tax=Sporolactobacillus shoreicorticis TaxID=1923877 RepID=A0ABW5S7A8_9BACL|nr:helix-turn-helix domain-containing protein [Sporolactobacillus shoreicorticis]MCO7127839.1 helix-turn-helix domain-containing protein [Sporolactobacillus shoreicorticis]
MKLDLNKLPIYSGSEASLLWGKDRFYVKTIMQQHPERFPKGTIRKIGKTWIVTQEGMEEVTGQKLEGIQMVNKLQELVGKTFTPHELDEQAVRITGLPAFFDRNGWETAVEQESFAYEKGDIAYNVVFDFVKKADEDKSILKVADVEQL